MPASSEEPWTPVDYAVNGAKVSDSVSGCELLIDGLSRGCLRLWTSRIVLAPVLCGIVVSALDSDDLNSSLTVPIVLLLDSPCCTQLLFAVSPLLVLAYILISAFESDEQEDRKRNKKSDFNLEGHSE